MSSHNFDTASNKLPQPVVLAPLSYKQAVAIYKAAHLAHLRSRSTMPDVELIGIAKNTTASFKTTNGLTNAIIKYVTYVGGFANRISSAGPKINKGGKEIYIPSTTKRGTPDIDIVFAGIPIKVEVKNVLTKDRISKEQSNVRERMQAAGAVYFIAESIEGFLQWFINEIQNKYPLSNGERA